MREGPLGAYVDDLARQLGEEGYARASVRYALQLVADLGRWMARCKIVATQLIPEHLDRYPPSTLGLSAIGVAAENCIVICDVPSTNNAGVPPRVDCPRTDRPSASAPRTCATEDGAGIGRVTPVWAAMPRLTAPWS